MTDMPPVATTVHVTEPSVCCETCGEWAEWWHGDRADVGHCHWLELEVADAHGWRANSDAVYTPATHACVAWRAR